MAARCVYGLLKDAVCQEVFGDSAAEYASLLDQWQGPALKEAELQSVAVIDPPLSGLPTLIAVAGVEAGGRRGWALIESPAMQGTGCFWYDASLRPDSALADSILGEHAGRRLLGWPVQPDRSNVLRVPPRAEVPALELASRFENMVRTASKARGDLRSELMSKFSGKIPESLGAYAASVVTLGEPHGGFVNPDDRRRWNGVSHGTPSYALWRCWQGADAPRKD